MFGICKPAVWSTSPSVKEGFRAGSIQRLIVKESGLKVSMNDQKDPQSAAIGQQASDASAAEAPDAGAPGVEMADGGVHESGVLGGGTADVGAPSGGPPAAEVQGDEAQVDEATAADGTSGSPAHSEGNLPAPPVTASPQAPAPQERRPSYVFFGVASAISLVLDVASKAWAEIVLSQRILEPPIELIENHLGFTLAYNRGGAWGLLQNASETIRRPFFFLVSVLAIGFIVSLYGRLAPGQRALKWGLPLVLGGALGNLSDRITRNMVIDFIDYRAEWIGSMNALIQRYFEGWTITDHWPTFNVADISICIGVGLMAIDMMTSRRGPAQGPTQAERRLENVSEHGTNTAGSAEASDGISRVVSDPELAPRVSSEPVPADYPPLADGPAKTSLEA